MPRHEAHEPVTASATIAPFCLFHAGTKRWSPPTSAWKASTFAGNGIRRIPSDTVAWLAA